MEQVRRGLLGAAVAAWKAGPREHLATAWAWRAYLISAQVAMILYLTVVPEDLRGHWYDAFAPVAGLTVVAVILARRPARWRPLAWIAAGLLMTGAGDITYTALSDAGLEPFPSVADGLYIAGSLCIIAGVARRFGRGLADPAALLEAMIVTVAGSLLLWEYMLEPAFESAQTDLLSTALALAYPLIDVLLLGLLSTLLLVPGVRDTPFRMTVVAAAAMLVSDILYAGALLGDGYVAGLIDTGWLSAYVLLGASVLHPSAPRRPPPADQSVFSRCRLTALAITALLSPVLLAVEWARGDTDDVPLLAAAAAALSVLVFARLALALQSLQASLHRRHELESALAHQARHDALTGLAKRDIFSDRLQGALLSGGVAAVLFIDVDDFKSINDGFGHQCGDEALAEIARRISARVRPGDLVARFGGDEFAVMLEAPVGRDTAEAVARRIVEGVREPITLGAHAVIPSVSIGVALSSSQDPEQAMREADVAMYLAKSQGKDRWQTFDEQMHRDVVERLSLRADLERAVQAGEFVVHYQPIVDIRTSRVTAAEALVRWQHPQRGLLPPAEFLHLAETTGLIIPLGRFVLAEALSALARFQAASGSPAFGMAVNVCARQFSHAAFVGEVAELLADAGVSPRTLTLEITESAILDTAATASMLKSLKELGVRIAIDDFGTGYSSLSYVGHLPIDEVKIDRSFTAQLGAATKEGALAASVISMGEMLELVTVAEGVEDASQLERLATLGCQFAQGFYLAHPMSDTQFDELLRSKGSLPGGDDVAA